jgi:hypothetical protein
MNKQTTHDLPGLLMVMILTTMVTGIKFGYLYSQHTEVILLLAITIMSVIIYRINRRNEPKKSDNFLN